MKIEIGQKRRLKKFEEDEFEFLEELSGKVVTITNRHENDRGNFWYNIEGYKTIFEEKCFFDIGEKTKAEKMFNNLGYELEEYKIKDKNYLYVIKTIEYSYKRKNEYEDNKMIEFMYENNKWEINAFEFDLDGDTRYGASLTPEEIKAIAEQLKELESIEVY